KGRDSCEQTKAERKRTHGDARRSALGGQADELLHAMRHAIVCYIADIEVAFGIDAEAMAPVQLTWHLRALGCQGKRPEFQRSTGSVELDQQLIGRWIAKVMLRTPACG